MFLSHCPLKPTLIWRLLKGLWAVMTPARSVTSSACLSKWAQAGQRAPSQRQSFISTRTLSTNSLKINRGHFYCCNKGWPLHLSPFVNLGEKEDLTFFPLCFMIHISNYEFSWGPPDSRRSPSSSVLWPEKELNHKLQDLGRAGS